MVRSLHFQGGIPLVYWGECILIVTHIINRIPSKILGNKTSYEVLNKQAPDYSMLKTFGCLCYASINVREHKFSTRNFREIFTRYPPNTKGYLVLDIENKKILCF